MEWELGHDNPRQQLALYVGADLSEGDEPAAASRLTGNVMIIYDIHSVQYHSSSYWSFLSSWEAWTNKHDCSIESQGLTAAGLRLDARPLTLPKHNNLHSQFARTFDPARQAINPTRPHASISLSFSKAYCSRPPYKSNLLSSPKKKRLLSPHQLSPLPRYSSWNKGREPPPPRSHSGKQLLMGGSVLFYCLWMAVFLQWFEEKLMIVFARTATT